MEILIVPIIFITAVALYFIITYNNFVTLKNRIKEAWSDIEIQLKRRYSLIPNLVESVKGYMKHEKDLLEKITALRTQAEGAMGDKKTVLETNKELTSALGNLKIAFENYPDLKANTNVLKLQEELTATEDKISYSRRFYNQTVLAFNNSLKTFPNVLLAGVFGFKEEEFFDAPDEETKDIKVTLSN
ncbi:LemA family protein [Patescibacteria group bacterium]|nr:LemA family protein [Patescibacteria group bacterium]